MKKFTLSMLFMGLIVGSMSAETVEVTSSEINAATEGSLLKVLADIPDATPTTIEFNFDGDAINYNTADCPGFSIANKEITINGLNKKNGKRVTINGIAYFMNLTSGSKVTIENLNVEGFKAIAFKMVDGTMLNLKNCNFVNNRDPKNTGGNNGGVVRAGGGTLTVDKCLFKANKGMGSYGGGAICLYQSSATAPEMRITNSTFVLNEAISGGAIAVNVRSGKGSVPSVYIANCTFANNTIGDRGGAIYMQTAEVSGSFAPVIVNCTFVGNINNIVTSDDGGAINLWSRNTTKMTPTIINNLFAEHYYDPWGTTNRLNDVKAFYLGGEIVGENTQPQTVEAVVKNNAFAASADKFYTVLPSSDNNFLIDFAADNIFAATEQNPWDEADPEYNHKTCVLAGNLQVAMISEASKVKGKGLASYEGIEIPTTDQLGHTRSTSAPTIGAIEMYVEDANIEDGGTGIEGVKADNEAVKVWAVGNTIYAEGLNAVAPLTVYDLTNKMIYAGTIENNVPKTMNALVSGVYLAKVGAKTVKFIVK